MLPAMGMAGLKLRGPLRSGAGTAFALGGYMYRRLPVSFMALFLLVLRVPVVAVWSHGAGAGKAASP